MSADLGLDRSGNGNDWAVNNITYVDQMVDSPTNNFATLNSLKQKDVTLSEGNLKSFGGTGGSGDVLTHSTFGVSSGKWYAEFAYTIISGDAAYAVGIQKTESTGAEDLSYRYYAYNGNKYENSTGSSYGASYTAGDIIGLALDMDAGTLTFYKNNATQGTSFTSISGDYNFYGIRMGGTEHTGVWNFGQDSSFAGAKTAQGNQDDNDIGDFYYTPPTGFLALCTSNLPAVAVTPSEHFNTVIYTGDGSTQAITGVGFQPDYVWIKERSTGASHCSFDVLRGVNKVLGQDDHGGQTESQTDLLTAFSADGFSLGANAGGKSVNRNTDTYVAWNWLAGGSGSANTDGNMAETVTVSANVDAGFSIITYTGDGAAATVGHGLSKAPEMIIVKSYKTGDAQWRVYHSSNTSAPETDYLAINTTAATADDSAVWNDTAPTADVFTIGDGANVNTDDDPYVAYCWHSVDGYSKMGSYTGNASTDGTFVYTGLRPAMIIFKKTNGSEAWRTYHNKVEPYNPNKQVLLPSESDAEGGADNEVDFLSNGFKLRTSWNGMNGSGDTYIFIAFAETPFKYSNAL